MKKLLTTTAMFSLLACIANAQLLDDGAFDDADSGGQVSNSAWTLDVNFPDGNDDAAQFQTGFANANNTGVGGTQDPGTGTGIWFKSFEGNQGGSGEPLARGDIFQSVVAPSNGDYVLSFVAGREVNFMAGSFGVSLTNDTTGDSVSVDLLTASIPDGNLGGAASGNPGGTPFSLTLPGVSMNDDLTVLGFMTDGMDSQIPGGQSAFLDSFVLAVPEPCSMTLIGLSLLGLLGLRRS